jgi:hypothetical protein
MTKFGALIAARGVTEGHVSKPTIAPSVLAAIKAL